MAEYLGDIELTDETLEHYGVPGMKWGVRKDPYVRIGTGRVRRISDTGTGTRGTGSYGSIVRNPSNRNRATASGSTSGSSSSKVTTRTNDPTKTNWSASSSSSVKAKAKSTTSSLLASASGSKSSKKKGKSGKSAAQKAKEKAEKEAAKKKKQEEREAAKKKKAEEAAAKKAAREAEKASKKEKTSGEKGSASNKSQQKEDPKLSAEMQKKLEEQTQKYIDYLEKRIKNGEAEKKFVYNPPSQERLRKKWLQNQRGRGMRHDDMEDGAIMIFPEELKKPGIDELFNKEGSD